MIGITDHGQSHVHLPEARVPRAISEQPRTLIPCCFSICQRPWLFTSPAACRRDTLLLTSENNTFIPLGIRTDCFYHYLSLSLESLDRWQIYLSHINPQASTTKQVSELNKNGASEIPARHNSPHRWNLGLLEGMPLLSTPDSSLFGRIIAFQWPPASHVSMHTVISCLAWSSALLGVAFHQNEGPVQSLADLVR